MLQKILQKACQHRRAFQCTRAVIIANAAVTCVIMYILLTIPHTRTRDSGYVHIRSYSNSALQGARASVTKNPLRVYRNFTLRATTRRTNGTFRSPWKNGLPNVVKMERNNSTRLFVKNGNTRFGETRNNDGALPLNAEGHVMPKPVTTTYKNSRVPQPITGKPVTTERNVTNGKTQANGKLAEKITKIAVPGTYNGLSLVLLQNASFNYKFTSNIHSWMAVPFKTPDDLTLPKSKPGDPAFFQIFGKGSNSVICLKEGTMKANARDNVTSACLPASQSLNTPLTISNSTSCQCHCKAGWVGRSCSVTSAAAQSGINAYLEGIHMRTNPRRVINALKFNMEFDLLEVRLHELYDVVDAFVVYESNYTTYGNAKRLRLLDRLLGGYLSQFHHKLVYIFDGSFPLSYRQKSWLPDDNSRKYLGQEGMRHLDAVQPDDIYIYTDADEVPSRDAILFLKMNDGYPEPFGLSLQWTIYGFFWHKSKPSNVYAGCTCAMFRQVFLHQAQNLRSGNNLHDMQSGILKHYARSGAKLHKWYLGKAGWHCSWCLSVENLAVKLVSAVNEDFPRWGDYPEKLKPEYLRNLVRNGLWFDGSKVGERHPTDLFSAPKYVLQHQERLGYLINMEQSGL